MVITVGKQVLTVWDLAIFNTLEGKDFFLGRGLSLTLDGQKPHPVWRFNPSAKTDTDISALCSWYCLEMSR